MAEIARELREWFEKNRSDSVFLRERGDIVFEDFTKYGANLLGGTRYKLGRIAPFFELRYIIEGGEQFVITAGVDLLFGTDY